MTYKLSGVVTEFNLTPGRVLARKYEVIHQLGAGWEGEVYLLRELSTGIERTAKLFSPNAIKTTQPQPTMPKSYISYATARSSFNIATKKRSPSNDSLLPCWSQSM